VCPVLLDQVKQNDSLQEVLREGARKMLAAAIESEVASFIKRYGSIKTDEGQKAAVRNGYLPERTIYLRTWNVLKILKNSCLGYI
jgi:hypothetical protein